MWSGVLHTLPFHECLSAQAVTLLVELRVLIRVMLQCLLYRVPMHSNCKAYYLGTASRQWLPPKPVCQSLQQSDWQLLPIGCLQALWSLQAVGSFRRTKGGMPVTMATWSSSSMTTWSAVPQQGRLSGSSCRRLCLWQTLCCKRHSGSLLRSCRRPLR